MGGTTPEINVFYGSTNLPSGGSYGFGDVLIGTGGSSMIFTVENLGTAALNLTGTPIVSVSTGDAAMFTVDPQPSPTIGPSSDSTFTITFLPASVGAKTTTVTIANDDSDENPYTFTLTGTGVMAPEINVKGDGIDLQSGAGTYSFGDVLAGSSVPATFTVENLGNSDLNLSGTPKVAVSGPDSALFVVTTQPTSPVASLGSTTFTVTFTPTSTGPKTATVTIANNDPNENPYTFGLTGNGIGPEINVRQVATGIPSGTGIYDFGSIPLGSSSLEITFTIDNLGTLDLIMNDVPIVAVGGQSPELFVVQVQPTSPIAPSGSANFTMVFTPAGKPEKKATVTIVSNDANENPYTFEVRGKGS